MPTKRRFSRFSSKNATADYFATHCKQLQTSQSRLWFQLLVFLSLANLRRSDLSRNSHRTNSIDVFGPGTHCANPSRSDPESQSHRTLYVLRTTPVRHSPH